MKNIPQGEHWAIVSERSITIPGDERSRTNPGHGYPEHTETFLSYEAFTDRAVFEMELLKRFNRTYERDRVVGLHVTEAFTYRVAISVVNARVPPAPDPPPGRP